jgi:hypothetical protein
LAALSLFGCHRPATTAVVDVDASEAARPAPSTPAIASDEAAVTDGPPPLPDAQFEPLAIPGHPDAVLAIPNGATSKRPVVVVIHGSGDRPDWQCWGWKRATRSYPFIVCPTGSYNSAWSTKDDTRYTHSGGPQLLAHIEAGLAALAARYPDYADTSTPLLAGFSLGAGEIIPFAVADPARFPRVVDVEGGADGWTDGRAATFVKGGGLRVLFGAGQRGNEMIAKATAKRLAAKGLDAHVTYAQVGHTFDVPLQEGIEAEMGWLMAGDARWAGVF